MEEKCESFTAGGSCLPAPGKGHSFSVEEKCVGFPGAGGSCVPAPESSRARFRRGSGARFQRECRLSRRRGKLCAGAQKAVSRRWGKVTLIHYRRKISRFSRRWGKLCPGAGKVISRRRGKLCPGAGKAVSGAGESCVLAPGKLCPGARERLARRRLV